MQEYPKLAFTADEKTRIISVAIASWLCGTIEGNARDPADMALAEALDSWLRKQRKNGETLYTGNIVCVSCGQSWEHLVLSTDSCTVQCPHCGAVQKASLPPQNRNRSKPENMDALQKIQKEAGDVVSRIAEFNQVIKNHHEQKGKQT